MRCFVVGNVTIDETFSVDALPREGESIHGQRRSSDLGGKGANQALMLARCGVAVTLIAAHGRDATARRVVSLLADEPLKSDLITLEDVATDMSVILSEAGGANMIVTTNACARGLSAEAATARLQGAASGDILILQGNLLPTVTADLIEVAGTRGMRVAFNPSPVDPAFAPLVPSVDMLFVNEREAAALSGGKTDKDAVRHLLGEGARCVVLTLGDRGALLGRNDRIERIPAYAAEMQDTTGAGDTFQGVAIAAALARDGQIMPDDLDLAARAAAITVSRFGSSNSMPTIAELDALRAVDAASSPAPGLRI